MSEWVWGGGERFILDFRFVIVHVSASLSAPVSCVPSPHRYRLSRDSIGETFMRSLIFHSPVQRTFDFSYASAYLPLSIISGCLKFHCSSIPRLLLGWRFSSFVHFHDPRVPTFLPFMPAFRNCSSSCCVHTCPVVCLLSVTYIPRTIDTPCTVYGKKGSGCHAHSFEPASRKSSSTGLSLELGLVSDGVR